jgi:hypothetical protein
MTTKPPSPVRPTTGETLETLAYASVADIPTADPHDRDRIGFNIWRWLKHRRDPLEVAFRSAGARLLIGEEEALGKIRARLRESGIILE